MQTYSIRRRTFEESINSIATTTDFLGSGLEVLLHHTLVLPLLRWCLVRTMSELRRGVDPLELNLLQRPSLRVNEHRFAQSHDALLDTRAVTLDQDEIVLDLTVADETTHADER
jgi:hypothetical protein